MELEEKTLRYHEIFNPGLIDEIGKVVREKTRFVYYTSAETAMSILRNNELWLRNATVMNDFSEINYGLSLVKSVFSGPEGDRFRNAVEDIFPGAIKKADELFSVWEHDLRLETYIACVSLHGVTEDKQGRLSM